LFFEKENAVAVPLKAGEVFKNGRSQVCVTDRQEGFFLLSAMDDKNIARAVKFFTGSQGLSGSGFLL